MVSCEARAGECSARRPSKADEFAPRRVVHDHQVTCDAATEQCCGTFNCAECLDAGAPCEGVALFCSSAAQCDGEVYCATGPGPGGAAAAAGGGACIKPTEN